MTGRSESIAFLVDETEERMFSDPFFLTMLRSAHEAVGQTGRQLVFAVTATSADHDRFVEYAAGGHVDGVLLLSLHGPTKLPQRLEEVGIPTMLSGRPLVGRRRLWFVDADNVDGGRLATEHLLRTGRRAVATVAGPSTMCAGIDRLAGYRVALEAADRPYDGSLVEVGEFTTASGHASMTRLLERRRDVDAVFVASDLTAIGAIRAIEASGRRVPDDVAVVGFDDIPDAADPAATADHGATADRRARGHDGPPAAGADRRWDTPAADHAAGRARGPRHRVIPSGRPRRPDPCPVWSQSGCVA